MVSPILRRMPKPPVKEEPPQKPFIIDESISKKKDSLSEKSLSSTVPVNQELLKIVDRYRDKDLPRLLRDPIAKTRDFFLTEVAPLALSVSNGLLEAREILKETFQEDPDTGSYTKKLEELAYLALEVRMFSFVQNLFQLTPEETTRFLVAVHAKELKGDDLIRALSQMLKVPNVQRPEEGSEVRMRQLQGSESGRVDPRDRRARANTKRRKP